MNWTKLVSILFLGTTTWALSAQNSIKIELDGAELELEQAIMELKAEIDDLADSDELWEDFDLEGTYTKEELRTELRHFSDQLNELDNELEPVFEETIQFLHQFFKDLDNIDIELKDSGNQKRNNRKVEQL